MGPKGATKGQKQAKEDVLPINSYNFFLLISLFIKIIYFQIFDTSISLSIHILNVENIETESILEEFFKEISNHSRRAITGFDVSSIISNKNKDFPDLKVSEIKNKINQIIENNKKILELQRINENFDFLHYWQENKGLS